MLILVQAFVCGALLSMGRGAAAELSCVADEHSAARMDTCTFTARSSEQVARNSGNDRDEVELAERAQNRILVMADGRALRGRTRQRTDGTWELARGGAWVELRGVQFDSWRLESDVLADFAKRRTELGRGPVPAHHRLELAHWCEGAGLLVEALELIDTALDEQPGLDSIERYLDRFGERVAMDFGLPNPERYASKEERERRSAAAEALATMARLGPSGRYLAANQLMNAATWELVAPIVHDDLRRAASSARRLACELVGRFAPGEEIKVLYVRALLDTSPDVRAAGARALGRADEPGLVAPIERALSSSNMQVQANAAQALGAMAQPAALPVIARALLAPKSGAPASGPRAYVFFGRQFAYVQDFDVEVATAASIADPQIGVLQEGSVLDVRVLATTIEHTVVRRYLVASAERLTGHSIGDSPAEWETWAKAQLAETAPVAPSTPN